MAYADATRNQKVVIVVNGIIRLIQIGVGVLTIWLYKPEKGYWLSSNISSKLTFELVLGAFAVVTGLVLALVPFKMSYRPVALACPWDLVMFFMYSAAFGYMRAINRKLRDQEYRTKDPYNTELFAAHELSMMHKVWVNLAGMGVFLTSAVMGAVLIWIGRKNSRSSTKHSAI
ncbi:uncharacterized protein Z520_03666 [Fonsecaea multimorphosa CBS 102226]|uniref:MARVEL domain-containing protein n=1 Tax=Fonsecaea multimorphosa CBS 102226 TaxID=1442371 RepID=A0A0D2KCU8_9EURO|nr:uncharacterized protein Z520_03666 [Fonsecaea multimorphosa CBS 102226]KIY01000.1 hypothetical protein Z520_03666 [Fonsecaea multimorphosa CBS 102226]OAL27585.1 hypothetical protein AYO22_03489 [Fonsecaea multimorphosa]